MDTQQELIDKYKLQEATMTDQEKSFLEDRIWALRTDRKGEDRATWLAEVLGGKRYEIDGRSRLFHVKEAAVLWERTKKDMAIRTAVEICQKAKTRSVNEGIPLNEAISLELEEYDSRPQVVLLAGGKVIRKGKPVLRRARKSIPPSGEQIEEPTTNSGEEELWPAICGLVDGYIDARIGDAGFEVDGIVRDFKAEMNTAYNSFRSRIQNFLSRGKKKMSFTDVLNACEVLDIDPPGPGEMPDMDLAKKKFRILVQQYHPDAGGNEKTKDSYQRVVDAHNCLKEFCRQAELASTKAQPRGQQFKR
jgi:hypothetical protein